MAEQAAVEADVIFVENDPNFALVLNAIQQLHSKGRLRFIEEQIVTIRRIQRALTEENDPLRYTWKRFYDFSRTAAVGFRMAMLEAMGVDRDWWPEIASREQNASAPNMSHHPDKLSSMAESKEQALEYWSHYDQLYPHYYIRQKYKETREGEDVPLDSIMVIFRGNFREMITIITKVCLPRGAPGAIVYNASVRVICTRYTIVDGDIDDKEREDRSKDAPAFQQVKVLVRTLDLTDTEKAKDAHKWLLDGASDSIAKLTKKLEGLEMK